jgi:hypothetical protein
VRPLTPNEPLGCLVPDQAAARRDSKLMQLTRCTAIAPRHQNTACHSGTTWEDPSETKQHAPGRAHLGDPLEGSGLVSSDTIAGLASADPDAAVPDSSALWHCTHGCARPNRCHLLRACDDRMHGGHASTRDGHSPTNSELRDDGRGVPATQRNSTLYGN